MLLLLYFGHVGSFDYLYSLAPLLTVGVQVDLPESSADSLPEEQEPLTTINSKGEIFIQESKVEFDKIIAKVLAVSKNRTDTESMLEETRLSIMVEF